MFIVSVLLVRLWGDFRDDDDDEIQPVSVLSSAIIMAWFLFRLPLLPTGFFFIYISLHDTFLVSLINSVVLTAVKIL